MTAITLDWTNCLRTQDREYGVDFDEFEAAVPELVAAVEDLERTFGSGWERWRLLPHDPIRTAHVAAVRAVSDDLRPSTENLVVLGIGGSALGNIAIHSALRPPTWNLQPRGRRDGPRLFVVDNVDPDHVADLFAFIESSDPGLRHTIVNVISKSGETAETAAQFLIMRDLLARMVGPTYRDRIIAITDPSQGTMRAICDREGFRTLPVPDGVGGRFSVLSPVGLFSGAMCGICIEDLLDGAAAMDGHCRSPDIRRNPAATLAWLLVTLAAKGHRVQVLMPYSNALYSLADWYRQLWAESLGKERTLDGRRINAGMTPVKALGATDQHSQVQLYREGPHDKVVGFVQVESFGADPVVPATLDAEALRYLHGAPLSRLLHAEYRATAFALSVSDRPNYTIRLPRIDADSVGRFIQLWQVATAVAGRLLNINAYDQPAVETGKQATFGLMGRAGCESWADRVAALHADPRCSVRG
ncbi:MAG: hypothetical protein KF817_06685 [Phycisphaeraceae bacterium]|nr:hypothetical protein [Phycisphaeraceae bacterium]